MSTITKNVRRCPFCSSACYDLADGRCQCRSCRRKFTPHPRRGRMAAATRRRAVQMFLNMISANRTAGLLQINRKTAQRIFADLRQRMALENDKWCEDAESPCTVGPGGVTEPGPSSCQNKLSCFRVEAGKVRVLPPGTGDSKGVCCSALALMDPTSGNRDWIGRLQLVYSPNGLEEERRLTDRFWTFARKGLRRYRAGYRKDLLLYLKEMAFRFNHPEEKEALKLLLDS